MSPDNNYAFIDGANLHKGIESAGYSLVYKEITYGANGRVKGNCDADLVLSVARGYYERVFERAVIVSSDGDYAGLVTFLNERDALERVLSPHGKSSYLLEKAGVKIAYLSSQRGILELAPAIQDPQNKKAPDRDETL